MSPSRPAYSSYFISRSASRMRCRITCLAVCAAMRPKSAGVSSHSRTTLPSSSSSCAITLDLAGLDVDLDQRLLGRVGHALVRGDERVRERLEHDLFGDALLDRERGERLQHLGILHAGSLLRLARSGASRCPCRASSPGRDAAPGPTRRRCAPASMSAYAIRRSRRRRSSSLERELDAVVVGRDDACRDRGRSRRRGRA